MALSFFILALIVSATPPVPAAPLDVWPKTALIQAYVHRAATRLTSIDVRPSAGKPPATNIVSIQVETIKTKKGPLRQGRRLAAQAKAEWHPYKDDRMLIVSLYPKAWQQRLAHLEVRYVISAGFVEEVWAVMVQAQAQRPRESSAGSMDMDTTLYSPMAVERSSWQWGLDSFDLTKKGAVFSEDYASRGKILLHALSPSPGRHSFNAARGLDFDFGDTSLGRVDFSYSLSGVKSISN